MRNTIDVMIGGLDNGQTPSVQQHDVNSRVFTCRLWQDKDVPFVLPENAVVGAVFKWRRSNGGHEYETQIEGRSTVLVTVPAEAVKLDGIVEMQLAIHQEDSVLHGPVISFAALKSLTLGGSAESEPPLLLVALAKETQELLTELRQAKENGEFDGYTPKRGVDYWTEEDVRRISGVLDAVASEHRHLLFGFENNEMKLCVSGSNDSGGTIQLLAQNIYQPQLGRKTLRDPSAVWYKGQLYLTYTIIDWASGSSNIGFCRTRDLLHFEELPQLPTNNSVYPSIPRCYAPAFCVIDGHIYIASAAVGEGGTFTNKYGETFDESAGAGWSVINRGNMMLHEYFPESHTLKFMGLLDGVPGIDVHVCKANGQYYASGRNFKLYKADALLGPYELIWDGTEYSASGEEVWREGAYLLEKPDSTWRFFAHKPGKAYEYYDSLTDDLNDGFAAEIGIGEGCIDLVPYRGLHDQSRHIYGGEILQVVRLCQQTVDLRFVGQNNGSRFVGQCNGLTAAVDGDGVGHFFVGVFCDVRFDFAVGLAGHINAAAAEQQDAQCQQRDENLLIHNSPPYSILREAGCLWIHR